MQNYPYNKGGRRSAQEVHQGTSGKRVHSEVQIPLCISLLFHQKEGRKITTYPGLPQTKSIYHQKQIPSTLDTGTDLASQRSKPLFEIRYTLGIQQCEDQRRRPTQSSIQNQIWAVRTKRNVLWPHKLSSNISSYDGPHTSTMGGQMGGERLVRILVHGRCLDSIKRQKEAPTSHARTPGYSGS